MGDTRVFEDERTGYKLHFITQSRASHINHTLLGSFHYSKGRAQCLGKPIGKGKLEGMLATENLVIRASKVTVRESFETGDIEVLELGSVIRDPRWENEGLRTEFGILARKPQQTPCPWRKLQEIEARRTMTTNGAGAAVIGERDQVYISTGNHAQAGVECLDGYAWVETSNPDIRIGHRLRDSQEKKFPELQEATEEESWGKRFKEDYTFFQLGRMAELKSQGRAINVC